jgi:hypothetical protein
MTRIIVLFVIQTKSLFFGHETIDFSDVNFRVHLLCMGSKNYYNV